MRAVTSRWAPMARSPWAATRAYVKPEQRRFDVEGAGSPVVLAVADVAGRSLQFR